MTSSLRRAGGFAAVGTLALAAPALGRAAAAPFALVAAAAFVVDDGPLFELFARSVDRREGRLTGLLGFALAATALAILASVPRVRMPLPAFVATVLVLAYGDLGRELVAETTDHEFLRAMGFTVAGFLAAVVGQTGVATAAGLPVRYPLFAFLGAAGALIAALLRAVLYRGDDPAVLLSVGLALWGFTALGVSVSAPAIAAALAITAGLGVVSYVLETASVPGMLTGILLGLLTVVLGGFGWFAVLITFFAVGGLSTKFRYDAKRRRGLAEDNEGARGSGNVLGNAAVALAAVLAHAAAPMLPVGGPVFAVAFAGSVAAAMSDTLSSEIGGLFDTPRLITTLEPVEPGTDGAVTWQGELAGLVGAALVAVVALGALSLPRLAAGAVLLGGVVGMTVDSLLGATVEGGRVGNGTVNLLATLAGAVVAGSALLA